MSPPVNPSTTEDPSESQAVALAHGFGRWLILGGWSYFAFLTLVLGVEALFPYNGFIADPNPAFLPDGYRFCGWLIVLGWLLQRFVADLFPFSGRFTK